MGSEKGRDHRRFPPPLSLPSLLPPIIISLRISWVIPRTFDPAPGWSATGHRIKAPMDYERGPEKTWVYGALRVHDGKVLTRCAASRDSKGSIASLTDIEADNPTGDIFIIDFQPQQSQQSRDPHVAA